MADTVIRAENLGKKFIIGHRVHGDSLFVEELTNGLRRFFRRGKSLLKGAPGVSGDTFEEFWALRDINFEVRRGELVSIIGHNGAGKTTLLKILSRITEPTTGRVSIAGRVTSLLEIGTGFHPELSGRENIFLNGAILGMTRVEVRRRFDEIVAFSGVEKFIDTPVKRYSVGMYARLAFAVAAHLEAEILVIDEVLAVGDAEFQARCLDRMSQVASSGRTVLFVSHNLAAVTALTRRAIVLRSGSLAFDGPVEAALAHYTATLSKAGARRDWGRGDATRLLSVDLVDELGVASEFFVPGSPLRLRVTFETNGMPGISMELRLRDELNLPVAFYSSSIFNQTTLPTRPGRYECEFVLDPYFLAAGEYSVDVGTVHSNISPDHTVDSAVRFFVETCSPDGIPYNFQQSLGDGHHAMRLGKPLHFLPRPELAEQENSSIARHEG
jgi:lipopolysaccharide transport system ATP-binding protein